MNGIANSACSTCTARPFCLPHGLRAEELGQFESLTARRRVRRGDYLYRAGAPFQWVAAIHSGSFKSSAVTVTGREQVMAFHMTGELLGLDGVAATGTYTCDVTALEDSDVCQISFSRLEQLARTLPSVQQRLHRIMAERVVHDCRMMMLLANLSADERVATMLLDLSRALQARGFSPHDFNLRMTREEIGSYLGLKVATVSRTLTRFQQLGMVHIDNKGVSKLDVAALDALVAGQSQKAPNPRALRTGGSVFAAA